MSAQTRQARIEFFQHRHRIFRVEIRQTARYKRRGCIFCDKPLDQVFRQSGKIIGKRAGLRFARIYQPAAQGLNRPHITHAGLFLDQRMGPCQGLDDIRIGDLLILRPFHHDVNRMRARELQIKSLGCGNRLLVVRHLVTQPVARFELEMQSGEHRQRHQPGNCNQAVMGSEPLGEIRAESFQAVDGFMAGFFCLHEVFFIAEQQDHQDRQQHDNRDEGQQGCQRRGDPECADHAGIGQRQRHEGDRRGDGGQHAGRTDGEDRMLDGGETVIPRPQSSADGKHHMHGVGEGDHHHQWRDHIDEGVEPQVGPAQQTHGPEHGESGAKRGDEHQLDPPEKGEAYQHAHQEARAVICKPVLAYGFADFQLHHRRARELHSQANRFQHAFGYLFDLSDGSGQPLLQNNILLQRQNDERELAPAVGP